MPIMQCKICHTASEEFASAMVMGKHLANYRRCPACGFVYVASPKWLAESYESAINRTDLGTVSRTETNSRVTKALIELALRGTSRFLDYGAGYGMFVRRMRDLGYNFWAFDRFCQNLFAHDFQLSVLTKEHFDLVTSFEVFEHTEEPMRVFEEIFACADNLLLTTELMPVSRPKPGHWWYYGLDHGQHIAFFTQATLEHVARRFSKHLRTDGASFHLLSARPVSQTRFKWAISERFSRIFDAFRRRPSLLHGDFQSIRRAVLKELNIESE